MAGGASAFAATAVSLAILLVASVSGLQCPPCGNQSVPYPLSTSSDCGHPNYKLLCTAAQSQLQLQTISGSYRVLDITSSSQVLVLAPPSFQESNGNSDNASCISQDLGAGGLVLNQSHPFSVTSANSLIFFNCSQILLQSPLNCSSTNPCQQALTAADEAPCRSLLCCSIASASPANQFSIPLNASACSAYTSVVSLDQAVSAQGWDFGVQLRWETPSEPPCTNRSQCTPHSVCNGSNGNLTCLCESGYIWDPFSGLCNEDAARKRRTALVVDLTSSLCVALIASVALTTAIYRMRRARCRAKAKVSEERSRILSANGAKAALFSSKEMKKATDNFAKERLLGSGGFGEVYKGILDNGTVVAIKAAKLGNVKGNDQVLNEVRILSQVNHRNLVRLLGCCVETEQPLMVYEYVPNGTLFEHLAANERIMLNWQRRMAIALETAEGLAYLHSSAYPPIIHRDIKSSNILLDAHLTAKVSDFGLSRLVQPDLTHVSTCVQGTLGYLDPHYYRNYQLTDKSDVYSYGVVLLELVTSQRAIDFTRATDDVNLAVYVGDSAARGQVDEVLDPFLVGTASAAEIASMKAVVFLALDCLKENAGSRPRMKEVAEQLDSILRELGIDRYV